LNLKIIERKNKHISLADIENIDFQLNKLYGLNKQLYEVLRDRPDIDTPAKLKEYFKN